MDRMRKKQKDIFYITGQSVAAASSSPFLANLGKKGLELLYMVDLIDEYGVQQLEEFDGKKSKSATKEGLDIDDETGEKKIKELKAECWVARLKQFKMQQQNGRLFRLLTTSEYGWFANIERNMKAQALRDLRKLTRDTQSRRS